MRLPFLTLSQGAFLSEGTRKVLAEQVMSFHKYPWAWQWWLGWSPTVPTPAWQLPVGARATARATGK